MEKEMNEKKKILIVDDDEVQHEAAENLLGGTYEIFKASSGFEALDYLYNSGFVPNLILLDILMPEMDGWEVYNRIKAISLLKNVPIAFLTSFDESKEKEHALEIGAADFILKPYNEDNLKERIGKILEQALIGSGSYSETEVSK